MTSDTAPDPERANPLNINCPACGFSTNYLRSDAGTHYYLCQRHGVVVLPPRGDVYIVDPDQLVMLTDSGRRDPTTMMVEHDAAYLDLLSSYEIVLEVSRRQLRAARALALGYRSGVRPPDDMIDAYIDDLERDEDKLNAMRDEVAQYKAMFRTH